MKEESIFNNYNDLKKHYIIMAITVQDLLKDPRYKDNKCLLLLTRPDAIPPKKRKKRKTSRLDKLESRLDKIDIMLNKIIDRLDKIETRLTKVEQNQEKDHNLLMSVIKFNNLKTK